MPISHQLFQYLDAYCYYIDGIIPSMRAAKKLIIQPEFCWVHPIIGTSHLNSKNAASKMNVPIPIHLIQILDTIISNNAKSHIISSSFWMPG